jgi:RecT family
MTDEPIEGEAIREEPQTEQPKPAPQNGNGQETATIGDKVDAARHMIPIGDRGVNPQTYAQWIDIAKDVCRAKLMLPKHLHDNAPVMAGLLEIAGRFQLSAYMLASQTYVQNDRLCFQAQAFGAILYASGLLKGRLRFEFRGEGDWMVCQVTGVFKDDPLTLCVATTPPVKDIHPGHTQKDGKTFVRGSPLWDKDREQQLAYFGERRWIRRFAPDACMGMYTREEIEELDEFRAERAGSIPLTADRLGQLDTGEGWGEGAHVETDLASISPEWPAEEVEVELEELPERPRPARQKAKGGRKPARRGKVAPPPPKGRPAPVVRGARRRRPPSKVEVRAAVKRAEAPRLRVQTPVPRWLDYVTATDAWIKAVTDSEKAEKRWDDERELRDRLLVPMGERSRLRAMLDRKLAQLSPKKEPSE